MMKEIRMTITALLILLVPILAYYFNHWYHKNIRSHPKAYAYEMYRGKPFEARCVPYKRDFPKLKKYYEKIEKEYSGEGPYPARDFNSRWVPLDTCIYILGYSKDSVMIEIACYGNFGPRNSNYFTGYIYYKTLQSIPARLR